MAKFRQIHGSFWEDPDILDIFTPEDRYFYLYLLTNPHTQQCGIYEISIKHMEIETGYNKDTIEKLIMKFENTYKKIKYSPETKEIVIINWLRYNFIDSPKVKNCIIKELDRVKDRDLIGYLYGIDMVYIGYTYRGGNKRIEENRKEEEENNNISDETQEPHTPNTQNPIPKKKVGLDLINSLSEQEVQEYIDFKAKKRVVKPNFDAESFIKYYRQNGGKTTSGNKLADWKAAIDTWFKHQEFNNKGSPNKQNEKAPEVQGIDRKKVQV
jgi:hypothetical protein